MERVRIDNKYVRAFPLWNKYGTSLYNLAEKDYEHKSFFSKMDVDCLDVDKIEIDRAKESKTSQEKTMDSCIGISAIDGCANNNRQLLLIELKLDCVSAKSVDFSDYIEKNTYTRSLLNDCNPICDKALFVFSVIVAPQVERALNAKQKEDKSFVGFRVVSNKDLEDILVPEHAWPVACDIEAVVLRESVQHALDSGDEDQLFRLCDCWKDKASKYNYRNKRQEHDVIVSVFRDCLSNYSGGVIDQDLISVLIDDFI